MPSQSYAVDQRSCTVPRLPEPLRICPPKPFDNPRLAFNTSSKINKVAYVFKELIVDLARKDVLGLLAKYVNFTQ